MKMIIYALMLILTIGVAFAFSGSSSTYTIGSSHTGTSGEIGSSTTFSIRSTTTFEQGGNQDATSSTFDLNVGHFSIENVTFVPIPTQGVWNIFTGTGMTYKSGETFKTAIQLRDSSNQLISLKSCYNRIRYPNNTIYINWSSMTELSGTGVHYYDSNVTPETEGLYMIEYKCIEIATAEIKAYAFENIQVGSWANEIDDINSTVTSTSSTVGQINTTVNSINTTIVNINTTINQINETISDMNTTIDQMNSTISDISELAEEINTTTHDIYTLLLQIDLILDEINITINNLEVNATVDLSSLESSLTSLATEVENNARFNDEMIFLITDSIVATKNAVESDDKDYIKEQLMKANNNLEKFKEELNSEEESNVFLSWMLPIAGIVFLMGGLVVLGIFRKRRNTISDDEIIKKIEKTNEVIQNE